LTCERSIIQRAALSSWYTRLTREAEKIGKIYLREPDRGTLTPIPWEDAEPGKKALENQKQGFLFGPTFVVYAGARAKSAFRENGEYDPQFGRVLRERLGDSNLETQLGARALLVENDKRSFKFILDSLDAQHDANDNQALLISNLARVVLDIEATGTTAPRDIHLKLATAFFQQADYQSSAQFFDRAGEKPDDAATLYFERGAAYLNAKKYDAAIRNLKTHLEKDRRTSSQALTHTNLGVVYFRLGRDPEAVSHYKKAIYLEPKLGQPYNGLAYLYAVRGEKLEEALRLVDRALALEKDADEIASDKDTKGWILYRMGKPKEALPLIREAAARIPDDPDILEHLKEMQKAGVQGLQK